MTPNQRKYLEKEAVKLYGLSNKENVSVKFEDMTLSISYDESESKEVTSEKLVESDEDMQVKEIGDVEKPKSKPKGRGRGRRKKS